MTSSEAGTRKSAILLMALGEDRAAAALHLLPTSEVQALGLAMSKLSAVSRDELASVLAEFRQETEQLSALHLGSTSYIRAVLKKALGDDRASNLLEDILQPDEPHGGIERLNELEAGEVAELIRDEHPQIIATILVHLDRHQAADILELFEEKLRNDVVLRIATFSGVQPAALQELTEVLTSMLDGQNLKRSKMGGVRTAAEILNLMNSAQEEVAIETVRSHSEDLAQKIIDEMFLFENLLDLDNRAIQMVLQEVETNSLVVALKGAQDALVDKFLRNMSQRAADLVREDMEARGPIRISQVETEQKAILQIVRRLADSGEIVLAGGDDEYV